MREKQSTKRNARLVLDKSKSIECPVGAGGQTIHESNISSTQAHAYSICRFTRKVNRRWH
jgi:hypothetical protein